MQNNACQLLNPMVNQILLLSSFWVFHNSTILLRYQMAIQVQNRIGHNNFIITSHIILLTAVNTRTSGIGNLIAISFLNPEVLRTIDVSSLDMNRLIDGNQELPGLYVFIGLSISSWKHNQMTICKTLYNTCCQLQISILKLWTVIQFFNLSWDTSAVLQNHFFFKFCNE